MPLTEVVFLYGLADALAAERSRTVALSVVALFLVLVYM